MYPLKHQGSIWFLLLLPTGGKHWLTYACFVCLRPGGLWSVFTLGGASSRAGVDQEENPLPLSNQSLLLLLVLANLTDGPDWPNPYRQAITCFRNTQGKHWLCR